jgi:hypothetical protein
MILQLARLTSKQTTFAISPIPTNLSEYLFSPKPYAFTLLLIVQNVKFMFNVYDTSRSCRVEVEVELTARVERERERQSFIAANSKVEALQLLVLCVCLMNANICACNVEISI